MSAIVKTRYPALRKSGFVLPGGVKMEAAHEGARTGRRMGSWGTSNAGPNAAVSGSLATARARSHEVCRNNSHAISGLETYVSNMVGSGISPRWRLDEQSLKEVLQEKWEDWCDEADADGRTTYYGLEELVARTEFESGEAIARFRPRRLQDGLTVPLQIQVMEPDHLDETITRPAPNGNRIHMGIELNGFGQRVAYHLKREHPGDNTPMSGVFNTGATVRVPAEDIMHVYNTLRPGQLRGLPRLTPILSKLYELDQYVDAELVRKKTAAMFSAFVTRALDEDANGELDISSVFGTDEGTDDEGQQIVGLEPGTTQYLEAGEDMKFADPADVGGNYEVWMKQQLRDVAAGIGCTYSQLTGDLTDVNYSSIRAGLLEFRRRIEMRQWNMLVFQFCRPVISRWTTDLFVSGAVHLPDFAKKRRMYTRVRWNPPGWEWVDPVKDQLADKMAVRNGFDSRDAVTARRGRNVETIDRENAADHARAKNSGLVYDSDPGQTTNTGQRQDDRAESAVVSSAINQ